jgi:hypothetical protein
VPMTTPPMPRPHPDFSPSQWIHPKMIDLRRIISISPPKTHHRIPRRGIIRVLFCLVGGKHSPQLTADFQTMTSTSSAVAPAVASLRKHLSANVLIRGQHNISASSASLSLPSNRPPHCRCPPGLTQAVDDALTPPTPPHYSTLQPSGHPLLIHRSSWIVAFTSLVLPRQTFQCGSMTAA